MAVAASATASLNRENPVLRSAERGYWWAMAAFVTWFGMGVESILRPIQDNRRDTFWMLPFACTMAAFYYLHEVQRRRSRTESISYVVVLIASAMCLLGSIGLQLDIKPLQFFGFPGGPITWLIGLTSFGIGTLLAGAVPKKAGWGLILLEPGSVLAAVILSPISPVRDRGAYSGNVVKGTALLMVALALQAVARRERQST